MSHEQIVQTAVFSLCQYHVLFCTVNLHCCNQSLSKNTCLFNFRCRLDLRKYFNNKLFPIYGSTACLYEHLWSQGSRVSAFLLYILCKSEGGAKRILLGYFLSWSRSGFPHSNFSLELSTVPQGRCMPSVLPHWGRREGERAAAGVREGEKGRWRRRKQKEEKGGRMRGGQEAGERRREVYQLSDCCSIPR